MRILLADIRMQTEPDPEPDSSYLEQEGFEERMADYQRGNFTFIGLRAVVYLDDDSGNPDGYLQSYGLWGIESDSAPEHLQEIFEEERNQLVARLRETGVEVIG